MILTNFYFKLKDKDMDTKSENIIFDTVAIIGIGLIGSSIARGIQKNKIARRVFGYAKTIATRKKAEELGYMDKIFDTSAGAVHNADLIILCVPVGSNADIMREIKEHLKMGAIITDVGSVKKAVIDQIDMYLPDGVCFIPGHPIAGTEFSGPESGFAELFNKKCCLLTPYTKTDKGQLNKLISFWEELGMFVDTMSPEMHDLVLATISHLPHLVAFNLVDTASKLENRENQEFTKYSAGGFLDYTRVASSDPIMWRDIFINNKKAVIEILDSFIDGLTDLKENIQTDNANKLESIFTETRKKRNKILDSIKKIESE